MRGGSQRAFCQSRRLASKDNKMLLMRRMEDSSLRLIYDCRLPICEVLPPLWRLTNTLVKTCRPEGRRYLSVRNGALTQIKMLKMKIEAGMCMKTQETMTKCLAKKQVFTRKCTHCARIDKNRSGLLAENAQVTR